MTSPPDTDLKRRVLASMRELPAPTRGEALRARAWILGCGVLGALVVFLLEGGGRLPARPPSLTALTSLGSATVVGAGMWFLLTRGRSALGRPTGRLAASALVTAILFIAWRYGVSACSTRRRLGPDARAFCASASAWRRVLCRCWPRCSRHAVRCRCRRG